MLILKNLYLVVKGHFGKKYYGELAQLGERLLCTQEVIGSIPLFSTIYMQEV